VKPYVVKQGDYLEKVAFELGFDAETVWRDPGNDALRSKRSPDLLQPGDVLHVPGDAAPSLELLHGTSNRYTAEVPRVSVRLVFSDANGPLKNEPYSITGFHVPDGKTDDGGVVKLSVPIIVREFTLLFTKRNVVHTVRVGDMDPIDEDSGVDKRLRHLGFLGEPPYGPVERASAIRAFQAKQRLPETGEADGATRDALVRENGS
jgi:hypothetical protein